MCVREREVSELLRGALGLRRNRARPQALSTPDQLSDTRVYEPQIRARLGTTAHFCKVVVRVSHKDLIVQV